MSQRTTTNVRNTDFHRYFDCAQYTALSAPRSVRRAQPPDFNISSCYDKTQTCPVPIAIGIASGGHKEKHKVHSEDFLSP